MTRRQFLLLLLGACLLAWWSGGATRREGRKNAQINQQNAAKLATRSQSR